MNKHSKVSFDDKIEEMQGAANIEAHKMVEPLIKVGDTLDMAKRWFEDNNITPTAADLLNFTKITLGQVEPLHGDDFYHTQFKDLLIDLPKNHFRRAIIDVCDTGHMSLLWLRSHNLTPTAADVIELTKVIVAREKALEKGENHP